MVFRRTCTVASLAKVARCKYTLSRKCVGEQYWEVSPDTPISASGRRAENDTFRMLPVTSVSSCKKKIMLRDERKLFAFYTFVMYVLYLLVFAIQEYLKIYQQITTSEKALASAIKLKELQAPAGSVQSRLLLEEAIKEEFTRINVHSNTGLHKISLHLYLIKCLI